MENFIIGVGVTILFFALIHITESNVKGNEKDLNEDEKKWLKNN